MTTTIEEAFTESAIRSFYPVNWEKNRHRDAETLIVKMFNHTAKWYGKTASPAVEGVLKKSVHTKIMDELDVEKLFKQLLKLPGETAESPRRTHYPRVL